MENTATDDITPKTPFYLRGTFYFYLFIGSILALLTALLITVIALRWVNPPITSFMLQQNWEELPVERYSLRDHWVHYESLPKHSAWAVVASEDQLFWQHWGFDFESIQEAWEERQEGERSRGASSITQQVAKNIFLWPAESFFRKGVEAGITVLIELFWPKERIIEVYLNIAEFGPGVFGVGLASEQFFEQNASQLEPDMAARLAAVLPNPKRMRVNPPSPYTKERSRWILRQMTRLSGISYAKLDSSVSAQASVEDSSAISDSLLNTQPVNSMSLTPDSLLQDSLSNVRMQNNTTIEDTSTDSIPAF
jgi:monofunctional biosynthetic peptidoglycan transglycosylase